MTNLSQITDLFTKLATHLHCQSSDNQTHEGSGGLSLYISSLTESLNHNATSEPASAVLDAALSLLCFKAPVVFHASIECLSDTIVALLSSSVSCRALVFPEHTLQVGSSLSCSNCAELIRMCADVITILDGSKYGMLRQKILRAVLKVASSRSCYNIFSPSPVPCENSRQRLKDAVQKLTSFLRAEASANTDETPLRYVLQCCTYAFSTHTVNWLRCQVDVVSPTIMELMFLCKLLFWNLDPSTLKHDISSILREKIGRPFLCMEKELHERTDWRSIIICLVTSPTMFTEARALLHHWFLITGFASLLELQTELVSSLLDALARPMRWGVSMDLGLKLPFLHAYFPGDYNNLLVKLSGPVLCETFLDLVHVVVGQMVTCKTCMDHPACHPPHGYCKQAASAATLIDHKSTWAMLMDFPAWFYFAAMLLFSGEQFSDIFPSAFTETAFDVEEIYDSELSCAAAKYLSWILNPINETEYNWLFHSLTEISGSWTLKQKEANAHQSLSCANTFNSNPVSVKKNVNKLGDNDRETNEQSLALEFWLKDFERCCIKYHEGKSANLTNMCVNSLFRKIPLGILIGYSRYLDDKAHELLLHYAATGVVLQSGENQGSRKKHAKQRSKGCDVEVAEECDESQGAASGASLVFCLFDIIEDMLVSVWASEENQCDFICNMKGKVGKYLLRCINSLIEPDKCKSRESRVMLTDLSKRLEQWRQQGRDVFEGSNTFHDVICDLKSKICS